MTTTTYWLENNTHAKLAFSLVFDGLNLVYTTTSDVTGIQTAFAGTEWTNVKHGLKIFGKSGQSIELFDPKIKPDSVTFEITDWDGTASGKLLRTANSSATATYLTDNLTPTSKTAFIKQATGFTSGEAFIGQECVAYSSATDASSDFMTITQRGKYSLFGTSSDLQHFGRYHRRSPSTVGGGAYAPSVRSEPGTWYNRMVGLYVHHYENGAWSTKAQSRLHWAGRIENYGDNGTGKIEISARSVLSSLFSTVMGDQFRGRCHEGITVHADERDFRFEVNVNNTDVYVLDGVLTTGATTYQGVIDQIQTQFNTWVTTGGGGTTGTASGHKLSISVETTKDVGYRTVIAVDTDSAITIPYNVQFRVTFYLHKNIWILLGWEGKGDRQGIGANSCEMKGGDLTWINANRMALTSSSAPVLYADPSTYHVNKSFRIEGVQGQWVTQPTVPTAYAGAEGFVQVGESIFAGTYTADADERAGVFTIKNLLTPRDASNDQGNKIKIGNATLDDVDLDDQRAPQVRQVWLERASGSDMKAGAMMLRLMLSTGVPRYNSTQYDVYEGGFGLGLPHQLVDVPSFLALNVPYELSIDRPTPFIDLLEPLLSVTGCYVVWRDGKIGLTTAGFDTPNAEDIVELTESNKGKPDDATRIEYTADGVINRITLNTYPPWDVREKAGIHQRGLVRSGHSKNTQTVEFAASISDFGQKKSININARGVMDPGHFVDYVVAPAGAYFSRPVGIIHRTINVSLIGLCPGDICTINDDRLIDPRTGERGVTNLACWVRDISFDWESGSGEVALVFLPEHDASKYNHWAPSAMVKSIATIGGNDVFTLEPHAFTRATDEKDSTFLTAGDRCRLYRLDQATATSHSVVVATVDTGTDQVRFTTNPLGGTLGGNKWAIEFDSISICDAGANATEQKDHVFIADADTLSTGLVAKDAYKFAKLAGFRVIRQNVGDAVDYSIEWCRPDSLIATAGRPLSAHKGTLFAKGLNNMLSRKTANYLISEILSSAVTGGQTFPDLSLAYGPTWVPLYGVDASHQTVRPMVACVFFSRPAGTGTAIVRMTSCATPVRGDDYTAPEWEGTTNTVTWTTQGASNSWSPEKMLTPVVAWRPSGPGTWITVEIGAATATAATCSIWGISLVESPLDHDENHPDLLGWIPRTNERPIRRKRRPLWHIVKPL